MSCYKNPVEYTGVLQEEIVFLSGKRVNKTCKEMDFFFSFYSIYFRPK